MILTVNDTNDGMQGNIEYLTTLLNKETIDNMVQTFKLILQVVVSKQDENILNLFERLATAEKQRNVKQNSLHQGARLAGLKALQKKK